MSCGFGFGKNELFLFPLAVLVRKATKKLRGNL